MRYVIDAYSWIEYLIGSSSGEKVKAIIENNSNEIFTSALTVAEVMSVIKREGSDFEKAFDTMLSLSKVYEISAELSKMAGLLHAEMKRRIRDFGLADSFVLASARMLNAKIVTGDEHFKGFKNVVFIKK